MPKNLILLFIFFISILIRIPALSELPDIDVSITLYGAQGIMAGEVMYKDFFDHKPPLTHFLFAFVLWVARAKDPIIIIRLFGILYALVTVYFIYRVAMSLFGERTALYASLFFGLFSGGEAIDGFRCYIESFLILPITLSFLYLVLSERKTNRKILFIFLSGLFIGISFLFKQTAIFEFLGISAYIFLRNRKSSIRLFFYYTLGFAIPLIFILIYFHLKDSVLYFINFAYLANLKYVKLPSLIGLWEMFIQKTGRVITESWFIWAMSFYTVILILKKNKWDRNLVFPLVWFLSSFLAIFPGGRFYTHYYIQLIPSMAILSAYGFMHFKGVLKLSSLTKMVTLIVGFLSLYLANTKYFDNYFLYLRKRIPKYEYYLSQNDMDTATSFKAAEYILGNSTDNNYIYVCGSGPLIYIMAKRRSPTRYFWMNAVFNKIPKNREVFNDIVNKILEKKPQYIVCIGYHESLIDELERRREVKYVEDREINKFIIYKLSLVSAKK